MEENFFKSFDRLQQLMDRLLVLVQKDFKIPFDISRYKNYAYVELWSRPELVLKIDKEVKEIWEKK